MNFSLIGFKFRNTDQFYTKVDSLISSTNLFKIVFLFLNNSCSKMFKWQENSKCSKQLLYVRAGLLGLRSCCSTYFNFVTCNKNAFLFVYQFYLTRHCSQRQLDFLLQLLLWQSKLSWKKCLDSSQEQSHSEKN